MDLERGQDSELNSKNNEFKTKQDVSLFAKVTRDQIKDVVAVSPEEEVAAEIKIAYEQLDNVGEKIRGVLKTRLVNFDNYIVAGLNDEYPDFRAMLKEMDELRNEMQEVSKSVESELLQLTFGDVHLVAQKELIRYEMRAKEIKDFLGVFRHDLVQNPFHGMRGFMEILTVEDDLAHGEMCKRYIVSQSRALPEMLDDILLSAKDPHYEEITGESVLGVERDKMLKKAAEKNVDLKFEIDDELEIFTARDRLNIVVRNFVNNALKYTDEGGTIVVSATEEGDDVVFKVKDSGTGIPKDTYLKLQELFDTSKTRDVNSLQIVSEEGTNKELGTGNGMKLSRSMADEILGQVQVATVAGEGSEFMIKIPRKKELLQNLEKNRELIKNEKVDKVFNKKLQDME